MKILIYKTLLLLAFFCFASMGNTHAQNKKYKTFYKSENKKQSNAKLVKEQRNDPDEIIEIITVGELDSLMKNMVGVTDIMQGGKSLLHPVITLELDPYSSASEALFGCVETLDRDTEIGKGMPEVKIAGIATVRRGKSAIDAPANMVSQPSATTSSVITAAATVSKPASTTTTPAVTATTRPANSATYSMPARSFNDEDWKLFRKASASLVNQSDKAFFKKYSIVVGTFKSFNNADYVKRTFNGLGERALVVKGNSDMYYAIVGSFDSETEAIYRLDDFNKKYVQGQSQARRISRYGVSLEDLWILTNE